MTTSADSRFRRGVHSRRCRAAASSLPRWPQLEGQLPSRQEEAQHRWLPTLLQKRSPLTCPCQSLHPLWHRTVCGFVYLYWKAG